MATADTVVISEKIVGVEIVKVDAKKAAPAAAKAVAEKAVFDMLSAKRYKIKPPTIDAALYITIADREVDGVLRPWELFIETKIPAIKSKFTLAARLASAIFRTGGPVAFVTTEFLDAPMEDGYYERGRFIPSIAHHIGLVLEHHLNGLGLGGVQETQDGNANSNTSAQTPSTPFAACPSCGRHSYVMSDGCGTCNQCGYSKCG